MFSLVEQQLHDITCIVPTGLERMVQKSFLRLVWSLRLLKMLLLTLLRFISGHARI